MKVNDGKIIKIVSKKERVINKIKNEWEKEIIIR
jgi:hypothetical protein